MTTWAWVLFADLILSGLWKVATIDSPRDPVSRTDAVLAVSVAAFYAWVILNLAGLA